MNPAGSNQASPSRIVQVPRGPPALVGEVGEGPGVERQERLVVDSGPERTQHHALGWLRGFDRGEQGAAHLPQHAGLDEPERQGQRVGRGMVAVGPQPQPALRVVPFGRRDGRRDERPTEPSPSVQRVDAQLGRRAVDLVGRVDVRVAHQPVVDAREQVGGGNVAAVAQVQHHVLREGVGAVGVTRRVGQGQDLRHLGRREAMDLPYGVLDLRSDLPHTGTVTPPPAGVAGSA